MNQVGAAYGNVAAPTCYIDRYRKDGKYTYLCDAVSYRKN